MHRLVLIALLALTMAVSGCATTTPPPSQQAAENVEWPTGPGTIPPSWYDYNPAYLHWYSPWYSNPEIPR
jgi:hypothetical protein